MNEDDNSLKKKFKFDFSSPTSSTVDVDKLKKFLSKDSNPVLIFYGGEPLLEIEKIKDIMDKINVPFRMQTNGLLLDKLPPIYLNRISKILISIDGDRKITDFNRGKGTFNKIVSNIKHIKQHGYKGELIARVTVSKEPDIFKQVRYLVENLGFESIHWQLDAGFYKSDYDKEKFAVFIEEYNHSISMLLDYWIKDMEQNERVLRLYPFIAIAESILKNEKTKLRCGAGHSGYAITTDRKIVACPIMNCIVDFEAGDLNTSPADLKKFDIEGDCLSCNYMNLCGGRCLYWNKTQLWPKEGNEMICSTIKHLIDEIKKRMPKIQEMIRRGIIMEKNFSYEKFFGPEIIP
jgi:putative peptide-modifying radical SAM enzyme